MTTLLLALTWFHYYFTERGNWKFPRAWIKIASESLLHPSMVRTKIHCILQWKPLEQYYCISWLHTLLLISAFNFIFCTSLLWQGCAVERKPISGVLVAIWVEVNHFYIGYTGSIYTVCKAEYFFENDLEALTNNHISHKLYLISVNIRSCSFSLSFIFWAKYWIEPCK